MRNELNSDNVCLTKNGNIVQDDFFFKPHWFKNYTDNQESYKDGSFTSYK